MGEMWQMVEGRCWEGSVAAEKEGSETYDCYTEVRRDGLQVAKLICRQSVSDDMFPDFGRPTFNLCCLIFV